MEMPCWSVIGLASVLFTVGTECGGTTDLPYETADHITKALASLHWPCIPEHIKYKTLC